MIIFPQTLVLNSKNTGQIVRIYRLVYNFPILVRAYIVSAINKYLEHRLACVSAGLICYNVPMFSR